MQHNLPLMRAISEQIHRDRRGFNQSYIRHRTHDGHIEMNIAGWAIQLAGGYQWIGDDCATYGQIRVMELAAPNRVRFADAVATELLGLTQEEASFILMAADDKIARGWLDDEVSRLTNIAFEQISTYLTLDKKGHLS
ncbi:hypothetical protein [Nocardia rhizosphaerae]|uniref:DNA-binding protein n=1 Tax=Nocardia rhizosphaerae TaxID=1691571 RepID=A0ABV8LDD6_9NOCA